MSVRQALASLLRTLASVGESDCLPAQMQACDQQLLLSRQASTCLTTSRAVQSSVVHGKSHLSSWLLCGSVCSAVCKLAHLRCPRRETRCRWSHQHA